MNEADQGGAEGCMSKIEGFNQKDLKKPPVYDMEAGNFPQVQKVDTALSQSTIDDLQDDLKMTHAVKKSANHALCINILGHTSGKTKSRVIGNAVDMAFESQGQECYQNEH